MLTIILDYVKEHIKIDNTNNPEVNVLINSFPDVYINCRRKNTIKRYEQYFKLWENWSRNRKLTTLPANPVHVSLFMQTLLNEKRTLPVIESTFYAIKFFHKNLRYKDPCKDPIVLNMFEVAKRTIDHKVTKKLPITKEHLSSIFDLTNKDKLCELRLLSMSLLAFAGFLRFDEVADIRFSDLTFFDSYLKVFISKSKTDVYRKGASVLITKTDSKLCPVKNVSLYLSKANITCQDEFIFRAVCPSKKSQKLKAKNTPISYSSVRDSFKKTLERCGVDSKKYGLHSYRSGGATVAANKGVKDRLFKRHGRWKSDKAKDGYVEDNNEVLLSVSKKLHL